MQSKSSTALAITSILTILIVFFMAIGNVEEAPLRKPFPSEGADLEEVTTPESNNQTKLQEESTPSPEDLAIAEMTKLTDEEKTILNIDTAGEANKTIEPTAEPAVTSTTKLDSIQKKADLLVKNINNELLAKVGYVNFVIKPKPFDGKLFDRFDFSVLSYLNIVEKTVSELQAGDEKLILRVYEFDLGEGSNPEEVYGFIKAKIKEELGLTINETNQFGLASFYINFTEAQENAFLVVKTRTNVYALSYPRAEDGDKKYFELLSKLLKELI